MGFYNYSNATNKWAYLQKKRTQEAEAKLKPKNIYKPITEGYKPYSNVVVLKKYINNKK